MTSYRFATPADEKFIVSGWSSSYRMSRDIAFIQMDRPDSRESDEDRSRYAEHMHAIVRDVLARPRAQVIVAEGKVLRGFICFEMSTIGGPPLVLYVYVAQPYRRRGIARGLFAAAKIDPRERFEYAGRTKMSWELLELHGKAPRARYNPLRARFAEEEPPSP